jgi:hypothetical protein
VLLVAGAAILRGAIGLAMLVIALVIAAGTLAGMSALNRRANERAVYSLAAAWGIVVLVAGGWLIPLIEPYRSARVIGEKLASLSARLRIEPVLLEYQEPGVVYALGRPVATTRDRDGFFAHLTGARSVLTVALPSEIDVMRRHFGLIVDPVDQVDSFVLAKGKQQTLQIAVVRAGKTPEPETASIPGVRRIGLKETAVK